MRISNRIFFLISISLLISCAIKAQAVSNLPFEANTLTQAEELPATGTYQFVLKVETEKPEITTDVLKQIKNNRDQNEITFIKLNESVKIKIHPTNIINAKDFKPFETYIYE